MAPGTPQQICERLERIFPSGFDKPVRRRPRAEVAEQLVERPTRVHFETGRLNFGKRKRQCSVTFLHELSFRGPVRAHHVAVIILHNFVNRLTFDRVDSVGPDCQDLRAPRVPVPDRRQQVPDRLRSAAPPRDVRGQ